MGGEFLVARRLGVGCASPTHHRRPGLRRVRRPPRSGGGDRGGGRGGGVPAAAGRRLAAAVRHGICLVAGGICTTGEARAAGLAPCLVQARTDRERLGGRLLVVRLGRGDALLVERRSDGSAAVSFTDGAERGGTRRRRPADPGRAARRRLRAGWARSSTRAGRGSSRPSPRRRPSCGAGRRASRSAGRRRGLLGKACPICRKRGAPQMPAADATFKEGGPYGEFAAAVRGGLRRGGVGAEEEGEAGAILGRRVARGGRVTWYDRLDFEAAGRLGAVIGAVHARSAGAVTLEVTSVHGRPVELRLRTAARWHGDVDLAGPAGSLRDIASALRGAPAAGRAGSAAASRPRSRST